MVLIHDPQPVPLIEHKKGGHWVWRCHIDLSRPYPDVWQPLRRYVQQYQGAIFSVAKFAQDLTLDTFIIPPSIDPVSEKNRDLSTEEIDRVLSELGIPRDRPLVLQVSRFDRFKDPAGVIQAYRMAKKYNDCLLILAGSAATDDPEGEQVLAEVQEYCQGDPDIFLLLLPAGSDLMINALQRAATIVLQKSLKEGFRLDRVRGHVERKSGHRGGRGRDPVADCSRGDGLFGPLHRRCGLPHPATIEQSRDG